MTIEEFAQRYRVDTRRDDCGDAVLGTRHQIYEYSAGRFALLLAFDVDNGHDVGGSGKSAKWVNARKKLLNAGFTLKQDGDAEGVALFDPEDKTQGKLALRLAGIRTRQVSPERKAALAAQLADARARPAVER